MPTASSAGVYEDFNTQIFLRPGGRAVARPTVVSPKGRYFVIN